ncbi:hypothetical protein AGLY_003278 [Aphis glycines]|uniref:DUF659 domain-containing protein n=1 Tax=Aphis glycines TaxID=307491 RepID=A0A6G0U0C2_APHGL|nr:hypothetical protein AGLY_003278 [Aphis glycines]
MPKEKKSQISRLKSFILEFGDNVFSTDGRVLFCKICEIKVEYERRSSVIQHIQTVKHVKMIKRKEMFNTRTQTMITQTHTTKKSTFNMDLCKALLSANIPLNKLSNQVFRNFLESYTGKEIPYETTLRKGYIDDCFIETMQKIREYISDHKIWISIDETIDAEGRFIANVIIGTLEAEQFGKIFLLNTEELEKANYSTVSKLFDKSLSILWPDGIKHDNVLLFLSDAAPYMVKCGQTLNALYSKMIHVTCTAHGLHRVAEQVRSQYESVDQPISNIKKIFRKAPSRMLLFKTEAPDLPLPPEPIIFNIVNKLESEDALSIKNAKKYLATPHIKNDLVYIKSNFSSLTTSITKLQTERISLADSIEIIDNVSVAMKRLTGTTGKNICTKMENIFKKNVGLAMLKKIKNILNGELIDINDLPEDLDINDLTYFKYAPITSVNVERSFSAYKTLLTNNRRSFKVENIKKHLIIQCNASIKDAEC